jgi:hypothetical protein
MRGKHSTNEAQLVFRGKFRRGEWFQEMCSTVNKISSLWQAQSLFKTGLTEIEVTH